MLKEFKDFLKVQNLLIENYKIDINENEKIINEFCNNLLDILQKYNLVIPDDKKNVDFTSFANKGNELLIKINLSPQPQNIDINNLLKNLFYDEIKQHLIKKIYKDLLNKFNKDIVKEPEELSKKTLDNMKPIDVDSKKEKSIIIKPVKKSNIKFLKSRKFSYWFKKFNIFETIDINKGILDLFIYDNNIFLLLIRVDNEVCSLSLIWENTSLKKTFIDKLYVKNNKNYDEIYDIFSSWADKNKIIYKNRNDDTINNLPEGIEKIEYQIPENIWKKIIWLPYMDTFKYCNNNGLLKNYDDGTHIYLLANKEGTFVREHSKKIYWENRTWNNKVWKYGTWKGGVWLNGTWENGEWQKGKWINGRWKNGTWYNGIWKFGKWYDGIWVNGIWKNGYWENGIWKNGIWESGKWNNGIWEDGTWNDGEWKVGEWKAGEWRNGVWENGHWTNGKWYNGEWKSGTWEKGEIYSKKFNQFIISNVSPDKFYEFEKNYKSLTQFIKNIN